MLPSESSVVVKQETLIFRNNTIEKTIECDSEILNGIFSQNNEYIVLTTALKTIEVFQLSSGQKLASLLF